MPILLLLLALPLLVFALMPLILDPAVSHGHGAASGAAVGRHAQPRADDAFGGLLPGRCGDHDDLGPQRVQRRGRRHRRRASASAWSGLVLTRWEPAPATLHYTPNRWLVLLVTVMVSARVLYGLWRSWKVAESGIYGTEMVLAFGIPESLAVGGAAIGYYVAYAVGVRRRIGQWQKRVVRVL